VYGTRLFDEQSFQQQVCYEARNRPQQATP
jgi:hypothetical protein